MAASLRNSPEVIDIDVPQEGWQSAQRIYRKLAISDCIKNIHAYEEGTTYPCHDVYNNP